MRTGESNYGRYYNRLGSFVKLATSYVFVSYNHQDSEFAWRVLQPHQASFQGIVERLATGELTSMDVDLLDARAQTSTQWKRLPPPRDQASPPRRRVRNQEYAARWAIKGPVDGLYWQLREWLHQETYGYLVRCASCDRFFLERSAAADTCSRTCRRHAHAMPRPQPATSQRRTRQARLREDLRRVREAKAKWRQAHHHTSPELSELLTALSMTRKRWTMLQQAERVERGKIWITDLTR
jgi:hypothetical protein